MGFCRLSCSIYHAIYNMHHHSSAQDPSCRSGRNCTLKSTCISHRLLRGLRRKLHHHTSSGCSNLHKHFCRKSHGGPQAGCAHYGADTCNGNIVWANCCLGVACTSESTYTSGRCSGTSPNQGPCAQSAGDLGLEGCNCQEMA
jgi:hypothetical protein